MAQNKHSSRIQEYLRIFSHIYEYFFMVLSVEAAILIRSDEPSANLILTLRKFGSDRLFVLLFAWLTLLPTIGPLPVKKHLFAILHLCELVCI